MHRLTDKIRKETEGLAARYGFSQQAVLTLFEALIAGHGSMAQFNHSEFAGMGQWTRGGMIMIGDMFDTSLRTKVNHLCEDLVALLDNQPDLEMLEQPLFQSQRQHGDERQGAPRLGHLHTGEQSRDWWGTELGVPGSTGSQGNVRYAYFPATRRLAISTGTKVAVYDTEEHEITGFSQQQGSEATLTFASQHGPVPVSSLRLVTD
jgi:hypothetical protein